VTSARLCVQTPVKGREREKRERGEKKKKEARKEGRKKDQQYVYLGYLRKRRGIEGVLV
jgi:hypothetical protein